MGGPPDTDIPGTDAARAALGSRIATYRRERDLTGYELGRLAGMSQAKVSKIETGNVMPTARDAERLGRALELSDEAVQELVQQAEELHNHLIDWRLASHRLAIGQRDLGQVETGATTIRSFQPLALSGLLQTAEYARAVLADFWLVGHGMEARQAAEVQATVAARLQRQAILADPMKRFAFLLPETVLMHRVCPPAAMVAQLERIREIAGQENASVGILPASAELRSPPLHGFLIADDRMVLIELLNTTVVTRGKADLRLYRRAFELYTEDATFEIDPILDRYVTSYIELARPPAPSHSLPFPDPTSVVD